MSLAESMEPHLFSVAPEDAAAPPKLGFLDALSQSYNEQLAASATYRTEAAMQAEEARNIELARSVGVNVTPLSETAARGSLALWNSDPYMRAARGLSAGGGQTEPITAENDRKFAAVQKAHPELGIKTYAQQHQAVMTNAQATDAEYRNSRWTLGGYLGGMLGAMGAQANLRYNSPFGLAAGLTPLGRAAGIAGVVSRVAGGAAVNAAIAGVQNLTGDQLESQMLGMQPQSLGQAVGEGALMGGGLGVLGEGAAALGRRAFGGPWFERAPNDIEPPASPPPEPEIAPQPPQPDPLTEGPPIYGPAQAGEDAVRNAAREAQPYGPSLEAAGRVDQDLSATSAQLDQWDGPPAGETDLFAADRDVATPEQRATTAQAGASLDEMAARIDPQTMREAAEIGPRVEALRQQIADAESRGAGTSKAILGQLIDLDERQRDLKPLVDRAYAMARQQVSRRPQPEPLAPHEAPEEAARATRQDLDAREETAARVTDEAIGRMREPEQTSASTSKAQGSNQTGLRLDGMGDAISANYYEGFFDRLSRKRGSSDAFKQNEPFWPQMRALHDTGKIKTVEDLKQALADAKGAPPPLESNEIQLPSGRTIRLDDVAEAVRDENAAGGVRATKSVRQMLAELEEDKALDAASRFCAL